jgi:hypothetical protein
VKYQTGAGAGAGAEARLRLGCRRAALKLEQHFGFV